MKKELLEKINRQQAILNQAKAEGRVLNADEEREMAGLQKDIEKMKNPEPTGGDDAQRAVEAERQRVGDISDLCREFEMDASEFIKNGDTLESVREAVIEKLKKGGSPVRGSARVSDTGEDAFRQDLSDAILIRTGQNVEKASTEARNLSSMSLRDMAITCLSRQGEQEGSLLRMGTDELFNSVCRGMYNPEAAFPAILDNAVQKSIVKIYEEEETTFQLWAGKGSVKDFKPTKDRQYLIGGSGGFELVPENGELKASKPFTKVLPTRKIDTYGTSFSMTRQAFIDDDIGFITEVPAYYAKAAKRKINRQVYEVLYKNGTIYDGKTLFHADHNNLITTGSDPNAKAIQEAILKMKMQKDPFDQAISINPKFIITPVGYEFDLYTIFNSAGMPGTANNDVNPLRNYKMGIIEDAELNALAGTGALPWFMAGGKHICVDYLNGKEVPTIVRMEKAGVLGFSWDIYLDWGVSVVDFRGLVKNPGKTV